MALTLKLRVKSPGTSARISDDLSEPIVVIIRNYHCYITALAECAANLHINQHLSSLQLISISNNVIWVKISQPSILVITMKALSK